MIKKYSFTFYALVICMVSFLTSCSSANDDDSQQILAVVPDGVEAISLLGEELYAPQADEKSLVNYEKAKADYLSDPTDVENIIWFGRRAGYMLHFREAITTFSEGIKKFPEDPRLYRHRAHRYISIREYDRAIADLEIAAKLIEGTEDEIEPDGTPNYKNIPSSTLHGNIWTFTGMAYYLKHDYEKSLEAFEKLYATAYNDDNRIASIHWRYVIKKRLGNDQEAALILSNATADMDVNQNTYYHKLCLFYKGEVPIADMVEEMKIDSPRAAIISYGVARWFYANGEQEKGLEIMNDVVNNITIWAGYGSLAAEADVAELAGT